MRGMTLEELKGRYESAKKLGPGTRYVLDLEAGERFILVSAAWALTGHNVHGTDRPDVQLIGRRQLEGAYRSNGDGLVLDVRRLTDTAGDGRGLGHPPPIRRDLSESIAVEVLSGPPPGLRFKLYGSLVELARL